MNAIEKTLMEEFLRRISLDIIAKEDWILSEAIRKRYGNKIDAEKFIMELKTRYFDKEYKEFEDTVREIEESTIDLSEKQLMYLAATVFAESILNKPVPASLIFEILRCAGMEEDKNFPNRYYFLRQLEEKGLIRKITVVNSKAEQLYCPTEEGRNVINGTDAFDKLIELKEKILSDTKVKKLVEIYSKEEINVKKDLPKLLLTSQIINENDNVVRILLYGREIANLRREEIEKIDSIAKELGRFRQSDLRTKASSRTKVQAYLVYAYNRGLIDIVDKSPSRGRADSVIFERKSV